MKNSVLGSPVVSAIRNSSDPKGAGEFPTGDPYYAIHKFNWSRDQKTKLITISDKYDYEYNDRYSGLAGTAINFLAIAQEKGELLPFYTTIIFA